MEKLKWSEKVTNKEVPECIGDKSNLVNNILGRNFNSIGHIFRRSSHPYDGMEGLMTKLEVEERRRI